MNRLLNFSIALFLILLFFPFLLIVGVLVFVKLGRPIFYTQNRPGLYAKPFKMVKFRSMIDGDDLDEFRITNFGKFLRSTSIDELPELWNVLKGDMSLVGPRPLLMEYLPLYTPEQARRHEVRPGITGWAQVNGRNAISWEDKFQYDVWYVDHYSLWLDIKILWLTVHKVFLREGVSALGSATMPKFKGNHDR